MSLHQRNLRTIAFLKEFQTVYLQDCEIKVNKSYLQKFQSDYPLANVIDTYRVSFNHYLVLLNLPRFDLSQSSVDLNQFLDFEYRSYILTFLKKSLDGLARLRKYYVYYRKNDEVHLINSTIDYYTPILWEIEIGLKEVKGHLTPPSPEIEEKVRTFLKDLDDVISNRSDEDNEDNDNQEKEREKQVSMGESADDEASEDEDNKGLQINFHVSRVVEQEVEPEPTIWNRISSGLTTVKNSIYNFCRRCFNWVARFF